MQVFPNQLSDILKEGMKPIYVTGGSETVLEEEASREILVAARADGIEDHEVLQARCWIDLVVRAKNRWSGAVYSMSSQNLPCSARGSWSKYECERRLSMTDAVSRIRNARRRSKRPMYCSLRLSGTGLPRQTQEVVRSTKVLQTHRVDRRR